MTDSIAQTYPNAATGFGATNTGSGGAKSTGTNKGTGTASGASNTTAPNGGPAANGSGSKVGVIAGAVAAVVVALLAIGAITIFLVKRSRRKQAEAANLAPGHQNINNNGPDPEFKPELAGNPINAMPPASPSPSMLKVNASGRAETVSPASTHGGSAWAPPPHQAELHGQDAPYPPMPANAAELAGQGQQGSPYASPNRPELMGAPGYPMQTPPPNRPELMGQQPGYQMPANRPELMGQQAYNQGYNQGQAYGAPPRAQEYNAYGNGNGQQQYRPQEAHGQPVYEAPGQNGQYQQQQAHSRPGTGHGQQQQQQQVYEAHSRPVTGHGQQPQPQQGGQWPMAELDGRYGPAR